MYNINDLSDKKSINHDVISIHRDDYGHGSTVNSSNMNQKFGKSVPCYSDFFSVSFRPPPPKYLLVRDTIWVESFKS